MYNNLDIFAKADADENVLANLGPLTPLAGAWEVGKGIDISSSATGALENRYREHITFELDAYHEEEGYWLWEPAERQFMRCFIVPRGVTVNAGGTVAIDATEFELFADVGSEFYGVTSSPYLSKSKRTIRYELKVTIHPDGRLSYAEDTQIEIAGRAELFHQTDSNTLTEAG